MTSSSVELEPPAAAFRELILAAELYRHVISGLLGVGPSESQALSYLLARGPMGQTELANILGVTSGSMTVLIDRLVERDYVERVPHPTDRRRVVVNVSACGEKALEEVQAWGRALFRDIPRPELPRLTRDMQKVTARMQEATTAIRDGGIPDRG